MIPFVDWSLITSKLVLEVDWGCKFFQVLKSYLKGFIRFGLSYSYRNASNTDSVIGIFLKVEKNDIVCGNEDEKCDILRMECRRILV